MHNLRYDALARAFMDVASIEDARHLKMLVVGAGKGYEVLALKQYFSDIIAIDKNTEVAISDAMLFIQEGDATDLPFKDKSFDVIYCYHVLEHIPNYYKALQEMRRVIRSTGLLYIGVPNKSRIVGYVSVDNCSKKQKVVENVKDYHARLRGRFENRYGAHAGFTATELSRILGKFFPECEDVTADYYLSRHIYKRTVAVLARTPILRKVVFPSLYFVCRL